MKLFIHASKLQQKMRGKEEEELLDNNYRTILENLSLMEGEDAVTQCFNLPDLFEEELCDRSKGLKLCLKFGSSINKFITLYVKDKYKIHDRLTLFFDMNGNHIFSEFIHTMGTKHSLKKMDDVKQYEKRIETLFSRILGEKIDFVFDDEQLDKTGIKA